MGNFNWTELAILALWGTTAVISVARSWENRKRDIEIRWLYGNLAGLQILITMLYAMWAWDR